MYTSKAGFDLCVKNLLEYLEVVNVGAKCLGMARTVPEFWALCQWCPGRGKIRTA